MVRNERKNAQKIPNNSQKVNFSVLVQSGVPGAIYIPWHAFRGTVHLVGPPQGALGWARCVGWARLTSAISSSCTCWFQIQTGI